MDWTGLIGSSMRSILKILGTWLAARYAMTCADLPAGTPCTAGNEGEAIAGVLLIAGGLVASAVSSEIKKRKLEKAIAAPAGQAE